MIQQYQLVNLLKIEPLHPSRLNTFRYQLGGIKLILLDEIKIVGNMFIVQLNSRLNDIRSSSEDFGGASITAIGDLSHLKPVMDDYIFNDIQNSEYSILAQTYGVNILECLNLIK